MLSEVNVPIIPINPPSLVAKYTNIPLKKLDGNLDKEFWMQTEYITDFYDIQGHSLPLPAKKTGVKVLYDNENLYFGAKLLEDQIWATVKNRDDVIYIDNDFEIFLKPDNLSTYYYEFEMNAMNTVWDLMLTKPYRQHGQFITSWNIKGLKSETYIDGKLNCTNANNKYWSLEVVMPFNSLLKNPKDGDVWRLNFSRVEYWCDIINNKYIKRTDSKGNNLPEENWVWAPTGVIDIHLPEYWGYLYFNSKSKLPIEMSIEKEIYPIYYALRNYGAKHKKYTTNLKDLGLKNDKTISIFACPNSFEIIKSLPNNKKVVLHSDGTMELM
jgi:hypothetical protein